MINEVKIKAAARNPIAKAVSAVLKPTYFESIPLCDIFDAIKESGGMIVVQEDMTPWSGMLCGAEGEVHFRVTLDGELVSNAQMNLQWYKMQSGKYEVCGYFS